MLEQKSINVYDVKTEPYDISLIEKALHEKLVEVAGLVSQPLLPNLTGGTKTMLLAAYQVAQQHETSMMYLQSEGKRTRVYHYAWENQQLRSTGDELLPECIQLQDVFDIYLGVKHSCWRNDNAHTQLHSSTH